MINLWNNLSPTAKLVVLWVAMTSLANLLAYKSQINAWAEKNPKVASGLKFLRAVGFDPWMLVQAASLALRGKLPSYLTGKGA